MQRTTSLSKSFRFGLALCLAGLLIFQLILPVQGVRAVNTWTVNSLGGDWDYSCDTAPGDCTLLDAVGAASVSGDSIGFAPSLYGTINLDFSIQTGAKTLTIYGSPTVQVSGQNTVQVFILINANLTLDDLTIQDGHDQYLTLGGAIYSENSTLTLTNSTIKDSTADDSGGAIYILNGTVNVKDSTFSGNSATGIYGAGGGIYNNAGTLTVTGSTFENNTTVTYGGGIVNDQGSLSVTNSTFKGNTAAQTGGGIVVNNGGSLSVTDTTFENNSGTWGGGIEIWGGQVTVANSTFIGNEATENNGGAIDGGNDLITVTNSTFSGNTAWAGGAIYSPSALSLKNSTFWGNTASTDLYAGGADVHNDGNLSFANNILANPISGGDCVSDPDTGLISMNKNNLVQDGSCSDGGVDFISLQNPLLGPLADNGGPTWTMALRVGSPAINAGANAACPATDQRGITRPLGGICDIGAYEFTPLCFVDADAAGLNDGSSWTNAYTSLQSTLGPSTCTEIWVAAGTYKPTTTPTDRSATFQLKNGVALYGGFAGTETLRQERNWQTNLTILSGDIGTVGNPGDNSIHVVKGATGAILDGFRITAGNANFSPDFYGGGMYNNASSPGLVNVTFDTNTAYYGGGGMYNNNTSNPTLANVTFDSNTVSAVGLGGGGMYNNNTSSPSLTNVTFNKNSAPYGGGMYNDNSSNPTLTNVTFQLNSASYEGGAMSNTRSNPKLTNVTFSANSATSNGGGMFNSNSAPTLTNVTFSANSTARGGGMFNIESSPSLTNVTFSGNSATTGGGICNTQYSNPVIKDSLFWGDGTEFSNSTDFPSIPKIEDSLIQGGCPAGATCTGSILNADPLLGALADNGGFTQTMALGSGSPAIDAGNNLTCAATDQRGVTRPQGSACDIGAFEYIEPTAVSLLSFTAQVEKKPLTGSGKAVILSWRTTSEVDNLGFNLYRANSLDGVRIKLNTGLIPTLVPPGSLFGAAYSYKDAGLLDGTLYYWLEVVDVHGGKSLTGPVLVKLVAGKVK